MEKKTTHRIIGVLVVIALVVILMPLLFGGNHSEVNQADSTKAPAFSDQDNAQKSANSPSTNNASADNANANAVPNTSPDNSVAPDAQHSQNNLPQQPAAAEPLGALDASQPPSLAQDNTGNNVNPADLGANPPTPAAPTASNANQPTAPSANANPIMPAEPTVQPGQTVLTGPTQNPVQTMPSQTMPAQSAAQQPAPSVPQTTAQNPMPASAPAIAPAQPVSSPTQPVASPDQSSAAIANPPPPAATPSISSAHSDNVSPSEPVASTSEEKPVTTENGISIDSNGNVAAQSVKKITLNKPAKKQHKHFSQNATQAFKQTAWVVQMGSFHNRDNAQRLANTLRAKGFKAFTREVKSSTRVYVGPEFKQASAESLITKLQTAVNIQGFVMTYRPLEL
jgi:cell division septation protein DedD